MQALPGTTSASLLRQNRVLTTLESSRSGLEVFIRVDLAGNGGS